MSITIKSNTASVPSLPAASFWAARREATLNWLALGLLLAAWNASDNDAASHAATSDAATSAHRRPEALRGYDYVSVRAAHRVSADRISATGVGGSTQ
ncbi:MAG TPA: hypothetical protein VHS76_02950 [Steroidobacteraceae bacterium]|nr:hypothetical protein [Steroidobacteraceae bacterium]